MREEKNDGEKGGRGREGKRGRKEDLEEATASRPCFITVQLSRRHLRPGSL